MVNDMSDTRQKMLRYGRNALRFVPFFSGLWGFSWAGQYVNTSEWYGFPAILTVLFLLMLSLVYALVSIEGW
jgi:hypothetical protein